MKRIPRGPINLSQIPIETNLPGRPGVTRQILSHDEDSGSITLLQTVPAGFRPPNGESPYGRRFEMHSCHEELFVLDGVFNFGPWYTLSSLSYLNHPPYWVHPAAQYATTSVTLLIKFSGPLDFSFEEIPEQWDGTEYVHSSAPAGHVTEGVTNVDVDALDWTPATSEDGKDLGYEVKHLWLEAATGWSTYIHRFPPGWNGVRKSNVEAGGDEWLLLDGALQLDTGLALTQGDYFCEPEKVYDGGRDASSEIGATAIRWCRGSSLSAPVAGAGHSG